MICLRFELYFRKNPFGGEYTVFAGLEECIRFIASFKFTEDDISFIRETLPPSCEVKYSLTSNSPSFFTQIICLYEETTGWERSFRGLRSQQ